MEFSQILSSQKKYRPISKICCGGFGTIFLAENLENGQKVALKVEKKYLSESLLNEYRCYKKLYRQGIGIPEVYDFFALPNASVLAMELLGPSLENLFQFCSCRFSLKTVLLLANQMISRVEHMHENHYLHRDIKPNNFAMGRSPSDGRVYILDFGLAKTYRDPSGSHIDLEGCCSVTGTTRYASVNSHQGLELSRRDDMESLGYVLVYFLRGRLPWQGITGTRKQRLEALTEKKQSIKPHELCNEFPDEFAAYLVYCRSLSFRSKPDYNMLRTNFTNVYTRLEYVSDHVFDWTKATEDVDKENQHTVQTPNESRLD